jgi:hypothetical protein
MKLPLVKSIYFVPLPDGHSLHCHVVDRPNPNIASVIVYILPSASADLATRWEHRVPIARLSITLESFKSVWTHAGEAEITVPREWWPNEEFRSHDWVGMRVYSGNLVVRFGEAWFGLAPWDGFAISGLLDGLAWPGTPLPPQVYRITRSHQ